MVRYIQRLIQHPILLVVLTLLLLCVSTTLTYHYTHTTVSLTDVPNAYAQNLLSERTIFNKVYNLAAARLQTDAWAQPTQPFLTVEEILNKVYDSAGQFLRTSAGGGGTSQAWPDITSGTNTNTLTMGTGGTMTTSGTGINNANQFKGNTIIPVVDGGTGLTSATDDGILVGNGTIYQLKTLPNCADTIGQHLNYTAATNSITCGTSGTPAATMGFDAITSGSNSTALMTVAPGGQITFVGAGIVNASQYRGNVTVAVTDGGTGLGTAPDNALLVGTGGSWVAKTLPDCDDTLGQHMNFDSATKTFTCGTSGGGGGGGGSFSALSSGTNTTAAMVVGSGASLDVTGTGTNKATHLGGLLPTDYATIVGVQTLTNTVIKPLIVTQTITANAFTINANITTVAVVPALSAGVTVNAPTGTGGFPLDGQELTLLFLPSTAPQSITWNAIWSARGGLSLPTSVIGDNDILSWAKFVYVASITKYVMVATTLGTEPGITTLTSATTYTCPHLTSRACKMTMTGTAGTVTIAIPSGGTPADGKQLVLRIKCTNAQTITLTTGAGGFVDSPNVPITGITCPAAGPSWTALGVEYSSDLDRWQLYATN